MTETELAAEVRTLVVELDLRSYHSHDARRDEPGWPDLVIWGPGGLIFRELKSGKGRSSVAQMAVLRSLREAGQNAAVWRPVHLEDGVVENELMLVAGEAAFRRRIARNRRV